MKFNKQHCVHKLSSQYLAKAELIDMGVGSWELGVLKDYQLSGWTSQSGKRWVRLQQGPSVAWLQLSDLHDSNFGKRLAAEYDIYVQPGQGIRQLLDQVGDVQKWPAQHLAESPGWHRGQFVLGDGAAIAPADHPPLPVLFAGDPQKWSSKGTLKQWRSLVAQRLVGQRIMQFGIMVAFAPPLLDLLPQRTNFGFEFVGPKGIGKSTLLRVISSVWGGPGVRHGAKFWETWLATSEGFETLASRHPDCLLALDEVNLLSGAGGRKSSAQLLRDVVFRLAQGHAKARFGQPRAEFQRLIFVSTANQSIASVLGALGGEASEAALDRLLTVPADEGAGYGILRDLPPDFCSSSSFIGSLDDAIADNHGTAIRAFLTKLVKARAEDEAALRRRIENYMAEFRKKVSADENRGSSLRVANAFGLVYAAGRLAKAWKVLPREWKCLPATSSCYHRHIAASRDAEALPLSATAWIDQHLRRLDILDLRDRELPKLTEEQFDATPGLIRRARDGTDELIIPPAWLRDNHPRPKALLAELDSVGMLAREKVALTIKRKVRRDGPDDRVHCIRLTSPSGIRG